MSGPWPTDRPELDLEIWGVHGPTAWRLFSRHHYLTATINPSARCFVAMWDGAPVAFSSALSSPGAVSGWRLHRTVCLPDYQGLGVGSALSEWVAWLMSADKPVFAVSGHPGLVATRARSPRWDLVRAPRAHLRTEGYVGGRRRGSQDRVTASFRWVGPSAPIGEFHAAMRSLRAERA